MWRQIISSLLILLAVGSLAVFRPGAAEAQNAVPTREVAPPGREPYHGSVLLDVPAAANTVNGFLDEPIPANRRLVIEYVSARVSNLPASAAPLLVIEDLIVQNNQQTQRVFVIPLTFAGADEWRAAHTLRLYHDGGGVNGPQLQAAFAFGPASGQVQFDVSISGYLIPR